MSILHKWSICSLRFKEIRFIFATPINYYFYHKTSVCVLSQYTSKPRLLNLILLNLIIRWSTERSHFINNFVECDLRALKDWNYEWLNGFKPLGLMVLASALHAEGRGFESRAGTFPDFFCWGICCAGVDLCYLSLIVTFWVGKLFLSYSLIYSVSLSIEQSFLSVFICSCTGCT